MMEEGRHPVQPELREAEALWTVGVGVCEYRRERLPESIGPTEVLVEAWFGAVSRGTEGLVTAGLVPVSERARMACPHMKGSFAFPVQYGYIVVGEVLEAGAAAGCRRGDHVLCLHPHQTRFVATGCVTKIGSTAPRRAVLAPNLETAINVNWDAGLAAGDDIAVVGGGVVGTLVAWVAAKTAGTRVTLYDRVDRGPTARALGLRFVHLAADDAAAQGTAQQNHDPRGCDVVVHCSGSASGLRFALSLAGDDATVVEASWHGSNLVALPLGEAFHSRRLTLRSSQVGQLPPHRRPRWDHGRRMALALDLAQDPVLDVLFQNPDIPFEDLATDLPEITRKVASGLCHRVVYPSSKGKDPTNPSPGFS